MIFLKIIVFLSCGALNALGGYHWLFCRRYIMPFVLAFEASYIAWSKKTKDWWVGVLILPVIGTLCLGYKNFGGGNFARAMWLFVQAIVIGCGLFITGHVAWQAYIGYCLGAGILGGIYKNWQQIIGDSIAGCYLGSIVFFIH